MHLYSAFHQMIILSCLVMLLCAFTSGVISHDPKIPIRCTKEKLTLEEPVMKITRCYIFPAKGKYVAAVVLNDVKNHLYCIDPEAPWLSIRMKRLKRNGVICEDYTKS